MTGEELTVWVWLVGSYILILLVGLVAGIGLEQRYQRWKGRRFECCECGSLTPVELIVDCACGLPCCVDCYDSHFQGCPEALEAAGVSTEEAG